MCNQCYTFLTISNERLRLGTGLTDFFNVILFYELFSAGTGAEKWGASRTNIFHLQYISVFYRIHFIADTFLHN